MALANSHMLIRFRSIFYGMWVGALVGGVLVTVLRPVIFGGVAWLDVSAAMRNTAVYVLPFVVAASFTLLPLLVRYKRLDFVGFTGAGAVAGVFVSALYLLAHRTLDWFSEASTTSIAYVLCSAVIVAWSVWAGSRVAEFIHRRSGAVD